MTIEYIDSKRIASYAKRLEKQRRKEVGRSLTFTGIARAASPFIVEIQSDRDVIVIRTGWREAMQEAARA